MLTFAVCGCGSRGRTYMKIAATMPGQYRCVAGADLVPERVEAMGRISKNPDFRGFDSAEALLAQPKLADVMVISTQDEYHFVPAKRALELGYDLLLEKPAAQNIAEVRELERVARQHDRAIVLCFVLRHTQFYKQVHAIVEGGVLGEIITLRASEGVEPFHQAHSFVRGHWSRAGDSTPMIVAKCCHDTDLIAWLVDAPCRSVSSFGSLRYFTVANAPDGATERCTDGCPHLGTCRYDAHRYTTDQERWLDMVYPDPDNIRQEEVREWLKTSPWGRCVYRCDNDVVDHQVVNMMFENEVTASLTMTAFDTGRHIEIFGTKASLRGGDVTKTEHGCDLVIRHHHTGEIEHISLEDEGGGAGYKGHGGGDHGLINALDGMLEDPARIYSGIEGHLMAFSAEESRLHGGCPVAVHPE
jgi:predicted dehydrogenase